MEIKESELKEINLYNIELQDGWRDWMIHTKKLSTKTINDYSDAVTLLFIWNLNYNNNKAYTDFNKQDFLRYQAYCFKIYKWQSISSYRAVRAAFSSFSRFILKYKHNLYPNFKNIVKTLPKIKNNASDMNALTEEDMVILLDYLYDTEQYEKACAVAIAACSGMSANDLLQMKASFFYGDSIITKDNLCYKTPPIYTTTYLRTKRYLPKYILRAPCKKYIKAWLMQREELGIDIDSLFAFYNIKKDRWESRQNLNEWKKDFSDIINRRFTFGYLKEYTYSLVFNSKIAKDDKKLTDFFENTSLGMKRVNEFISEKRRVELEEKRKRLRENKKNVTFRNNKNMFIV